MADPVLRPAAITDTAGLSLSVRAIATEHDKANTRLAYDIDRRMMMIYCEVYAIRACNFSIGSARIFLFHAVIILMMSTDTHLSFNLGWCCRRWLLYWQR
jgi:hypothetical protein